MSHTPETKMSTDTDSKTVTQCQERHIDMKVLREIFDILKSMKTYFEDRRYMYSNRNTYGYEQISEFEDCYNIVMSEEQRLLGDDGPDYESLDMVISLLKGMDTYISGDYMYDGLHRGHYQECQYFEDIGDVLYKFGEILEILPKLEPQVEG
jgi:hypothetical protein